MDSSYWAIIAHQQSKLPELVARGRDIPLMFDTEAEVRNFIEHMETLLPEGTTVKHTAVRLED